MTTASLRIHLFHINRNEGTEPLQNVLRRISRDSLEERVRQQNGTNYRLEDIVAPRNGESIWELNFVRMRDAHGPGRVSKRHHLTGFDLDEDEYFGEDTAVLFNQSNHYAVVQYNHWGVRPHALQEYLSGYRNNVTNIYELRPKLDRSAERRFQDQTVTRRISIGIDPTKMTSDDLIEGRSLTQIAKIGTDLGAHRVDITISMGSTKKGKLKTLAKNVVKWAMDNVADDALLKLTSYGGSDPEGDYENIDLLEEKLEEKYNLPVESDKRISLENRIKALKRAYSSWRSQMS